MRKLLKSKGYNGDFQGLILGDFCGMLSRIGLVVAATFGVGVDVLQKDVTILLQNITKYMYYAKTLNI